MRLKQEVETVRIQGFFALLVGGFAKMATASVGLGECARIVKEQKWLTVRVVKPK